MIDNMVMKDFVFALDRLNEYSSHMIGEFLCEYQKEEINKDKIYDKQYRF